jgi:hypothetical protein
MALLNAYPYANTIASIVLGNITTTKKPTISKRPRKTSLNREEESKGLEMI